MHAADTSGASNIVVLTQLQPISVVFTLPQQALPAVARAMEAGTPEALAVTQGASTQGIGGTVLDHGRSLCSITRSIRPPARSS